MDGQEYQDAGQNCEDDLEVLVQIVCRRSLSADVSTYDEEYHNMECLHTNMNNGEDEHLLEQLELTTGIQYFARSALLKLGVLVGLALLLLL